MRELDLAGPVQRAVFLRTIAAEVGIVLEPAEIAALAEHARVKRFKKGDVLLQNGERAHRVFQVISGAVQITSSGKEIFKIREGETVGFLAVLARSSEVDAVALHNTTALAIHSDALLDVMEDHFGFYERTMRALNTMMIENLKPAPGRVFEGHADPGDLDAQDEPIDLVQRLSMLRDWQVFASGKLDSLSHIASSLKEVRYDEGEEIWQRGDAATSNLMVVSGLVRVTASSIVDGEDHSWLVGTNFGLGSFGSLSGLGRWYDCHAETPVRGLKLETENFLDVLEDDMELGRDFIAELASMVLGLRMELGRSIS